jgi:hypothetical protein
VTQDTVLAAAVMATKVNPRHHRLTLF